MNDLRRSAGIGIIERGVAARGVFESLRKRRIVALLADQDARKAGVFVDFLGSPASTFQGPAQFACRTGSPLVCCAIVRRPDETHDAILFPPIYPKTGVDRDAEVLRLTQEHAKILGDCVRRHPEQYFWAHRRWKTRPPISP
jgi:KDO2-lipid IV(A) lauroyltransferase